MPVPLLYGSLAWMDESNPGKIPSGFYVNKMRRLVIQHLMMREVDYPVANTYRLHAPGRHQMVEKRELNKLKALYVVSNAKLSFYAPSYGYNINAS